MTKNNTIDAYKKKVAAQLTQMEAELKKQKGAMDEIAADQQINAQKALSTAERKMDEIQQSLSDVKDSGEQRVDDLQTQISAMMKEAQQSLKDSADAIGQTFQRVTQ